MQASLAGFVTAASPWQIRMVWHKRDLMILLPSTFVRGFIFRLRSLQEAFHLAVCAGIPLTSSCPHHRTSYPLLCLTPPFISSPLSSPLPAFFTLCSQKVALAIGRPGLFSAHWYLPASNLYWGAQEADNPVQTVRFCSSIAVAHMKICKWKVCGLYTWCTHDETKKEAICIHSDTNVAKGCIVLASIWIFKRLQSKLLQLLEPVTLWLICCGIGLQE